jgi:hypothetical protein
VEDASGGGGLRRREIINASVDIIIFQPAHLHIEISMREEYSIESEG